MKELIAIDFLEKDATVNSVSYCQSLGGKISCIYQIVRIVKLSLVMAQGQKYRSPVRTELTNNDLLILLANHYTT